MTENPEATAILLDRVSCRVIVAGRQTMPPEWSLAPRTLPFHDIIFVETGRGIFRCGDRRREVRAPAWVILPAGVEHTIEGTELRLAVAHVEIRLGDSLDAARVFSMEKELSPRLPRAAAEAFQSAIDAWSERTPVGRICANRWMELWFARAFGAQPAARPMDPRLVAALAWFQANAGRRVLLREAARHVGVSAPHLRSLFNQHLGVSPKKALQDIRLSRAREALEQDGLGVAEVAYQGGWGDVSGFSRSFRSHFGVSPGAYKRRDEKVNAKAQRREDRRKD